MRLRSICVGIGAATGTSGVWAGSAVEAGVCAESAVGAGVCTASGVGAGVCAGSGAGAWANTGVAVRKRVATVTRSDRRANERIIWFLRGEASNMPLYY